MEVSEMNLADGEYTVEVTMEGGSGPGFNTVADRIDNRKRTGTGRNRLEQFSL